MSGRGGGKPKIKFTRKFRGLKKKIIPYIVVRGTIRRTYIARIHYHLAPTSYYNFDAIHEIITKFTKF